MSILNFPRIHFSGWCRFHEPTGNQNKAGNIDLTTNEIYMGENRVDSSVAPEAFYQYYSQLGIKYNREGQEDPAGIFSEAAGRDLEGNSRVSWNAKVVSTQTKFGIINTDDPLVERSVNLWGHYNEYLATTFNQPKVVELDSASQWTRQIYAGHFTLGREESSISSCHLINGGVQKVHHARWHKNNHIINFPQHWNDEEIRKAAVYQFVVEKDQEHFYLNSDELESDTLIAFQEALKHEAAQGLVVQYCLFNASEPIQPSTPTWYSLVGTVGIWYGEREMATYPAGRILHPVQDVASQNLVEGWGTLAVELFQGHLSLNMAITLPIDGKLPSNSSGPVPEHGEFYSPHDLFLFCQGIEEPLTCICVKNLQKHFYYQTSGIFDFEYLIKLSDEQWEQIAQSSLFIAIQDNQGNFVSILQEKDVIIQADRANIYLEIPCEEKGIFFDESIEVRSFVRGIPRNVNNIHLHQVYNPANFPFKLEKFQQENLPDNQEHKLCLVKCDRLENSSQFQTELKFNTNEQGRATITLRGLKSGGGRIVFAVEESENKFIQSLLEQKPFVVYDDSNQLNFWNNANVIHIKVLPQDWHLIDIPQSDVDFKLMYEHVLQFYELLYPFMNREIFSLSNKARVESFSLLSWQMCDPINKDKSYYMPPTRELSYPKALLFQKFLMNVSQIGYLPCCHKKAVKDD